jgi:glycosyltransferase involved in cell wall biosynthesis
MRICVICEGSYPFVAGGVSSWLQELILHMPQHEFIVWAIAAQEKQRGQYKYTTPANIVSIQDEYLDAVLNEPMKRRLRPYRLDDTQKAAIRALLSCRSPNWQTIFSMFGHDRKKSLGFLMSQDFLKLLQEISAEDYPYVGFTDYFWTIRSMFLPLLYLLGGKLPEADLYHSVSAGYAGVLGAMAAAKYKKPFVLTEHGIYTREREEEILRTEWVPPHFKDLWINMFYMFTRCAYDAADCVTSLFHRASLIQQEIGCLTDKCRVISNGVHAERLAGVRQKEEDDFIDIGAVVRIVPIKDIKTMLYAFSLVCSERDNVRLHILGPKDEDEDYYEECLQLMHDLELEHVVFTGRVDVKTYLEKIDFTLLTSISEGQPLAVLEAMASGRAVVATDVGNCRELLEGVNDDYGKAGICVPVMHQGALADAMLTLCDDAQLRRQMGLSGQARVTALYGYEQMLRKYLLVYEDAAIASRQRWNA